MLVQTNKRPSKDSILPSPFVFERFLSTMRAIQGTLIVASSVQIILGYSQLWAICSRFFSPLGMVPVIALGGFGLFDKGFPVAGQCVKIGVPMFILFVIFSQYLKNFQFRQLPVMEQFALIMSITVIWTYAHLLTASDAYKHHPEVTQKHCRTDRANLISTAPWNSKGYNLAKKFSSKLTHLSPVWYELKKFYLELSWRQSSGPA